MAMKGWRQVFQTDISHTASGTMERGGIATKATWADGLCYYAVGSGGPVAGMLLEDVEALNPMNHPQYMQRRVSPQGSVVGLATEGEFWTDMYDEATYSSGDTIYLGANGKVTNDAGDAASDRKTLGTCLEGKDSHNFIKIRISI